MNLRDYPEVFGSTIFCDDIRQETGGKSSLIGCYASSAVTTESLYYIVHFHSH
jgi:hypothetical protein